jgi:uncharacterized DUF497 family protein
MRFEWDDAKRRGNLKRHGIDFAVVEKVLNGDTFTVLDDRFDYGEMRFQTLGLLRDEVVAITHTESDEVIRVISIRKATKHEEESYFKKSDY